MLTMFKRLASLVPTPATNKVTLFVSDTGIPSYKDDAGLVTPMSGQPIPAGYIDGLKMEWVSGTQMRFTSGSAYIPSLGRALALPSALTKTLTLSPNTWYHNFLYSNAGTSDVETVTTLPDAPYSGTARAKTGDNSRRYIGSFRTDASAAIIQFTSDSSGMQRYMISNASASLRVISNGKASARTTVSLSAVLPPSATAFQTQSENTDPAIYVNLSIPGAAVAGMFGIAPGGGKSQIFNFSTAADQSIDYSFSSAPSGGFYMDVIGFFYAR